MGEEVKDCSSCKTKPVAGTPYHLTACAGCKPWEPGHDHDTVTFEEFTQKLIIGVYESMWYGFDTPTLP